MHRVPEGSSCAHLVPAGHSVELTAITDGPPDQACAPTVGAALERLRLAHRVRRVELVLGVLHDRARVHTSTETVPAGLAESIDAFSRELAHLRRRLAMSLGSSDVAAVNTLNKASA